LEEKGEKGEERVVKTMIRNIMANVRPTESRKMWGKGKFGIVQGK